MKWDDPKYLPVMFKLLQKVTLGITTVRRSVDCDSTFFTTPDSFEAGCKTQFKKNWANFEKLLAESTAQQINRKMGTLRKTLLHMYTKGHGRQAGQYLSTVGSKFPARNPIDPLSGKWDLWRNPPICRIDSNKDLINLRLTFSAQINDKKLFAKTNILYNLKEYNTKQYFSNYRKIWVAYEKGIPKALNQSDTKKRKRNDNHSNNSNSNTNSHSNSNSNRPKPKKRKINPVFI